MQTQHLNPLSHYHYLYYLKHTFTPDILMSLLLHCTMLTGVQPGRYKASIFSFMVHNTSRITADDKTGSTVQPS